MGGETSAAPGRTRAPKAGWGRRGSAAILAALLAALGSLSAAGAQSDPRFSQQWGLQRIGAQFAWRASTGAGVLIAVIDSGVDAAHPDLAGKVLPGRDLVDGDGDPKDQHGHGTLVAGVAAAVHNNGEGIAPVAPDARILPIRVIGPEGKGEPSDAAEAIRWSVGEARRLGRPLVVNLSLDWPAERGSSSGIFGIPLFYSDPAITAAIKEAAGAGAAVIIAAGNEGQLRTPFDGPEAGIVVVGATDRGDGRADFSNYGPGIDIAAPGVEIISTYWSPERGSVYGIAKGTSMSVAFVSGTAALLMARGMTGTQAVTRILTTAQDLAPSGRDDFTGRGLLDTAAALGAPRVEQAPPPPPPPPSRPPPAPRPQATPSLAPAGAPTASPSTPPPPPPPPPPRIESPTPTAGALPSVSPTSSAPARAADGGPSADVAVLLLVLLGAFLAGGTAIIRVRSRR